MCGRFALSAPAENIRRYFNLAGEVTVRPRFNIAPGQMISVVRESAPQQYELAQMLWGLLPFWAKEPRAAYNLINARAETLEAKKSFKDSFKRYRCLIPADGFYEWKKIPAQKKKQPYFIQLRDRSLFGFAGLWSTWKDPVHGKILDTCAIVTTGSNTLLSDIHDRMPVIIQPRHFASWVSSRTPAADLKKMFVPLESELLEYYPVSGLCNRSDIDTPECIAPL